MARLQADGQIPEHLSGVQIHGKVLDDQNPVPSQNQEPTQEGETHKKALSPNSLLNSEPPQQAQDKSPNPVEGGVQQSDLPPKITATKPDIPENDTGPSEVKAGEVGQPHTTSSQAPPQRSGPSPPHGPQPDQDEESGEARVAPSGPPPSEPPQGPGPTSLSPQKIPDKETESAEPLPQGSHHDLPEEPSQPDPVKQPPLKEETPKSADVRAGTPYPELPPPQDTTTNTKQTQDTALLPRSRLAPTRLPQPRTLAPLQSRRPTPKLLSPSREEAVGTSPNQEVTPSPRPVLNQEGDTSKLPPISPPNSKPPPNLSPQAADSAQPGQEEKASEVKLPPISPPIQEQAPQHIPSAPLEDEAPTVRLPRIPTPFTEPQLPQSTGAHPDAKPAKERRAPRAGHSSGRKIPDVQASPHSQDSLLQKGARKKKLPLQRKTAKGPVPSKKAPPRGPQVDLPLESQSKPGPTEVPGRPDPIPPLSPQGNLREQVHTPESSELPHTEPSPRDPRPQEEKRGNIRHSRKKAQTHLPPRDLVQEVGVSKKRPSLKALTSDGLSQENETALSGDQPTQEVQPPHRRPLRHGKVPAEPAQDPERREQVHKKQGLQKREIVLEPPEQEGVALAQPVRETPAPKGTRQIRESPVQRDNGLASKQQTKEKQPPKNMGATQDKSAAAPQNQVSSEEKASRTGRLRARGSQSTKV